MSAALGEQFAGGGQQEGARVWVANSDGNSVTELGTETGALVRMLAAPRYGFNDPSAITVDGGRAWVANLYDDSVTEFPTSPQQ